MIGGVLVISGSTVAAIVMLIAFSLNVVVIILRLLNEPSAYDLYFVAVAWLTLSMVLGWAVARAVFAPGRVSYHRIVGAVLLYLLIALTFVALYLFVGLLIPKAFSGIVFEDNAALASGIIYFSFVTLTTVGYGDVLPVHPIARSLCNLESIFGQLYPATLLARLVTLEIEGRRK
jgi:Ion channel